MQLNLTGGAAGGGVVISTRAIRSADAVEGLEPAAPAGKTVTAWVKTDANTAAANLPGGHGYTDGNFDVYWEEGDEKKRRYGVPGTIATDALSLDGGTGDDFPASATSGIVVTKQFQVDLAFAGDSLVALALNLRYPSSEGRGSCAFYDAADALVAQVDLPIAPFDIEGGATNPFAGGDVTYALCSNGHATLAAVLQMIVARDSTP